MKEQKRTFCRVCEPACGLIATVENNELISLQADKSHPISKGFVCNKGIYGADMHNDPDRTRVPLKQVAPGRFEEISWDKALSEIAERLKAIVGDFGSSALACYTGNPAGFNALFGPAFTNFSRQLGIGKYFSSGTQDCSNKFVGSEAVFGTRNMHPLPDIDNSDFILLLGENPAVSHMSFISIPNPMQHLKDAENRGAKVVYINPREIESASRAGRVIKIKPDTDVYLLAALLHEIHAADEFDKQITQSHGKNLEELIQFVQGYSAKSVAAITGITESEIKSLAHQFAQAPSACAHLSTGVNMGRQGTLAYWLMHMLVFVTGNLGKSGGNFYSQGFYTRAAQSGRREAGGTVESAYGEMRTPNTGIPLPANLLPDYVLDEKQTVRAMFVNSGNPVLSVGGEDRMRKAFASLDLLVCVDIYRNASAEYADYILPATGAFEREDINITGLGMQYEPSIQFTEAVVPAKYKRKSEAWIYASLCKKMGFSSDMTSSEPTDPWARINAMLKSRGRTMQELKDAGIIVFEASKPVDFYAEAVQTDDKLVDCFPDAFASALKRMSGIYQQLSREPADQLKLISKRDANMFNSWFSNLPKLKKNDRSQNYLFMHPHDAEKRQIREGDKVSVSNHRGEVIAPVRISDEFMQGVVAMSHGWGHQKASGMRVAQKLPGVNCNILLPSGKDSFEPLSNQAHMTGIPVEVRSA